LKTVIVACGAGVATSTILSSAITNLLKEEKIKYRIIQCSLNEVRMYAKEGDLIVTSMPLKQSYSIPTVLGISFLTGMGEDETKKEILAYLKNKEE